MNTSEQSQPPFAAPLKEVGEGRKGSFLQVEGRPETFIRHEQTSWWSAERLRQERELFDELRRYVPVPNYQPVVGSDSNGKEGVYLLAETIDGDTLTDYLAEPRLWPAGFAESVNRTCQGLADYLCDNAQAGRKTYWDIKTDNFMYGTTERDSVPRLYVSDLDPTFTKDAIEAIYYGVELFKNIERAMPLRAEVWNSLRAAAEAYQRHKDPDPRKMKLFMERFDAAASRDPDSH